MRGLYHGIASDDESTTRLLRYLRITHPHIRERWVHHRMILSPSGAGIPIAELDWAHYDGDRMWLPLPGLEYRIVDSLSVPPFEVGAAHELTPGEREELIFHAPIHTNDWPALLMSIAHVEIYHDHVPLEIDEQAVLVIRGFNLAKTLGLATFILDHYLENWLTTDTNEQHVLYQDLSMQERQVYRC